MVIQKIFVTLHRKALLKYMEQKEAINTLNEIKDMMEKSSRFQSISGWSIIIVGLLASVVSAGAWLILLPHTEISWLPANCNGISVNSPFRTRIAIFSALLLLVLSFFTVSAFSLRKMKKQRGAVHFDTTLRRCLLNFSVPMLVGGLLCAAMLMQGHYGLTSTLMLVFYGLALINCSHYTASSIAMLGYAQLVLGIIDCFAMNHAILFWWLGFGLMHIVYGIYFTLKTK